MRTQGLDNLEASDATAPAWERSAKWGAIVAFLALMLVIMSRMSFVGDPMIPSTVGYSDRTGARSPDEFREALIEARSAAQRFNRDGPRDTHSLNVVGGMILDYRSYDTLIECVVLFTALTAVLSVLCGMAPPTRQRTRRKKPPRPLIFSPVVDEIVQKMAPFIFMFGVYVVFHGEISPGGGFQGGVIMGATLIMLALVFGLEAALDRFKLKWLMVGNALGPAVFIGIGLLGIALGKSFLTHGDLPGVPHGEFGTLLGSVTMLGVNIGIGIAVASVVAHIFFRFISCECRLDEGEPG